MHSDWWPSQIDSNYSGIPRVSREWMGCKKYALPLRSLPAILLCCPGDNSTIAISGNAMHSDHSPSLSPRRHIGKQTKMVKFKNNNSRAKKQYPPKVAKLFKKKGIIQNKINSEPTMQSNQIFRRINFCLDDKIYYNFIYFFLFIFCFYLFCRVQPVRFQSQHTLVYLFFVTIAAAAPAAQHPAKHRDRILP